MELLKERIKEPSSSCTGSNGLPEAMKSSSGNYFNSKFANFDTICGFEEKEPVPVKGRNGCINNTPPNSGRGDIIGSIGTENGCINIKLPMAYTYMYDPKPKLSQKKKKKTVSGSKPKAEDQRKKCPPSRPINTRIQTSDNCEPPPFCSTVTSLYGPPNKGYFSQCLPECGGPPKGRNKTTMKWDFEAGMTIPVKKVDYGEELYEKAARNLAMAMALEKSKVNENGKKNSSSKFNFSEINLNDDKCVDFSTPRFNSSMKVSNELAKALEGLRNLPTEMERIFKADKRFEPLLLDKATKVLNVPRDSIVFKDLVSVEPNETVKEQVSKTILDQVQAVQPVRRSRDPEPNILDYQEVSFSRIKPEPVPEPPKPKSGVSVDLRSDYQMVESEKKFEDEADRI